MKILSSPTMVFLILAGILSANFVLAANLSDVLINEVAWMGTEVSHNDEWIELYNKTDSPISLEGWTLKGVALTGTIEANGFYLLERTDDNSVPDISADQTYTGALNNKCEPLELHDSSGKVIDSALCQDGWLAGDNSTKQTMERKDINSWQTSQEPEGTPKSQNSTMVEVPPQTDSPAQSDKAGNLAGIKDQTTETSGSLPVLLIALGLAIFSGIIILLLKKKLKIGYNKGT